MWAVCFCVLASDSSFTKLYVVFWCILAGIGSRAPKTPNWIRRRKWMDVCLRRGVVCRSAAVGVGGGVKGSGNGVRGGWPTQLAFPISIGCWDLTGVVVCGVEQQRQLEGCANKSPANKYQLTCKAVFFGSFCCRVLLSHMWWCCYDDVICCIASSWFLLSRLSRMSISNVL